MGEEISPPAVEESTEPPLCGPKEGINYHSVSKAPNEDAHNAWANTQSKVAHTLTSEEIAGLLGVDPQYV
jgi:hypothetical protein